jgi:tetratricopeptide (TPR) repeat protein
MRLLRSSLVSAVLVVVAVPAISWAQAPLKKAPMSDDPLELYTQGAVLVATGKLDAGEKLAKTALQNHPQAYGFHLLLGDVHLGRRHFAEAFYEWQWEFLRFGPGTTTGDLAARRIGDLLSTQRGTQVDEVRLVLDSVMLTPKDPKSAVAKLEKIRNERGNRFALRHFIAEALHQGGSHEQAAAMYRELIRDDAYFVAGYVQLAVLLKNKGNQNEALELMAKARSIDPENWRLRGM